MDCCLTHGSNSDALKPGAGCSCRGINATGTVRTVPLTYLLLWRLARCWRYLAF